MSEVARAILWRMALRAFALAGLALLAPPLRAHDPDATTGLPWTFDPWVSVPLVVSLAWFALGYRRLAARSAQRHAHRAKARCFAAGWLVMAGALVTPLHAAGERSFTAHMIEHELLMLVGAPLLVMSRPVGVMLWALPRAWRLRLAGLGRHRGVSGIWHGITGPVFATLLQAAVLWIWHAPAAFDLALANPGWHIVQHLCFVVSALLFWWAMLRARVHVGVSVAALFFTSLISGALGALMAFSRGPWYAGYTQIGLDAFGLSPAEDQQLAGLLMWVPGGLLHAAVGVALLARVLRLDAARTTAVGVALLVLLAAPLATRAETVYVSDEEANVLHVIRPPRWTVAERIDVGQRPRGLQLSRDGRSLFVAVSNDNRIDAVDLATGKVGGQVPSGPDPERFSLSPDGRTMYIANEDDALVSFVDLPSRRIIAEVPVGAEPEGMATSPDGRWVICTSETASLVHFIDAQSRELVDSVLVGTRPRDAVFSRDGRWLWVSSEMRATVAVFDMQTRKIVRTIDFMREPDAPTGVQAVGLALTPDYTRAFVALGRGNHVAEVEPATGRILRYFPVGHRNWSIALSPDSRRLYAASGLSGDVTVIDLVANRPMATIKTGGKPWGVEVSAR